MSTLTVLPNELKEAIFANLTRPDLLSLNATCKSIHQVAQPALFSSITLKWIAGFAERFSTAKPPVIKRLFLTLAKNADIARCVKSLEFSAKDCVFFRDDGIPQLSIPFSSIEFEKEEVAFYEGYIDALQIPMAQEWKRAMVDKNNLDLLIVLLLVQCNQLQSLKIPLEFLVENVWLRDLLKHTQRKLSGTSPLKNLSSVHIISESNEDAFYNTGTEIATDIVKLLFYLPRLESFHFSEFAVLAEEAEPPDAAISKFWPLSQPPAPGTLTTLRLERSKCPLSTLMPVLDQAPSLRSLSYDFTVATSDSIVDLQKLHTTLKKISSTLEDLKIGFFHWLDDPEFSAMDVQVAGSLGPFREFNRLTSLELPLPMLFEDSLLRTIPTPRLADVLPPNLRRLVLADNLWPVGEFGEDDDEGFPEMVALRHFISRERLSGNQPRLEDMKWTRCIEPAWSDATPELQEIVLDLREIKFMSFY